MEKSVEFFVLGNKTCICRNGESRHLRPTDRDAVTFMLENISRTFPEALEALQQFASASQRNLHYYEFIMVDRFIRCNFGEADFLHPDIDDLGMFHFEEVRCPLRGYCKDEGKICKPKPHIGINKEEEKVVSLYANGLLPGEIAKQVGKSESTCKKHINNVVHRLKLPHARALIRLYRTFY